VIDGAQVHCMFGGWDAYLKWREERGGRTNAPAASKTARKAEYREARKLAGQQRRLKTRLAKVETAIESIERELAEINTGILTAAECGAIEGIRQLSAEHQQRTTRLEALWEEWEEVGEELGT